MKRTLIQGIGAVVFDAVGTLINPDPPVAVAYAEAASRQGVRLEVPLVRSRFSEAFARSEVVEGHALSTDEGREARRWRRIVAEVLPEIADQERAFRELWDHFGDPGSWRAFEDVGPGLQAVRSTGLVVGIASNFDGRLRPIVRSLPDLNGWEGPLAISSEVGWKKPHPGFYEEVCRLVGSPPGEILYIGDDPANDLHGPAAIGMRSALLDRSGCCPHVGPRLRALGELMPLLRGAMPAGDRAGSLNGDRPVVR